MKDGSVRTFPTPCSPDIRCAESVIDPELHILCVKDLSGRLMGLVVNFACHPTHHGGDNLISAGFPGRLSASLKERLSEDCITIYLNGAFGDVHHVNSLDPDQEDSPEYMGSVLSQDILSMMPRLIFSDEAKLSVHTISLRIPYRNIDGSYGINAPGCQRLGGPRRDEIYDESIEILREKQVQRDFAPAEIQAIQIGDTVYLAVPGEYFSALGLRIKTFSPYTHTCVVAAANGMLGYIPTRSAFERGGYEVSLSLWSKLFPEAGDMIADAAIELIERASKDR